MAKSEKRDRFEKVASSRVEKILSTLALLKNCSNRNNYEYTESDVNKMFTEISRALKEAKNAYLIEINKTNKKGFNFDD